MMTRQAEELLSFLAVKSLGLDELHERVRQSGSAWTRDQLELFLHHMRGITRDRSGAYHVIAARPEDELAAAVVEAVRSFAGRPVPAAQVRARLPQHLVTTDEQIVALARRIAGLELVGPNFIRSAP